MSIFAPVVLLVGLASLGFSSLKYQNNRAGGGL
jgi:hypothetical protein